MAAVLVVLAACAPVPGRGREAAAAQEGPPGGRRPVPVVRLPLPRDDGSLTPYTFQAGYPLVTLVYDTLLWRDDAGVPRPWLAESVDVAPDGRRVTIRLDPRARWHDGLPVTAADVAFTFSFVRDRPHARFTPQLRAVAGVEVVDPATVVVALRHPSAGFLDQPLADLPILPAHLWSGLDPAAVAPEGLPVGSGPYRLVAHGPGGYRFEAVGDHFRGAPAVEVVEVPVIGTFAETLRAFERREVDMVPVSLPEAVLEELDDPTVRVREGPGYAATVLLFDARRPPFDRPEVRRAVAGALDVTALARAAGPATAATRGWLHPASRWAPEAAPAVRPARPTAAARRAAAELLGQLPPIEVLATASDSSHVEAARHVARDLRRAGARAEAVAVEAGRLAELVTGGDADSSFGVAVWTAPALASHDPDHLYALFGSAADAGLLNHGGYRSPAFEAAARAVASAADLGSRQQAVEEELRVLADEVPAVPLLFPRGAFAYRPGVYDGWRFVKGAGVLDKRSFVDPFRAPAAGLAASGPPSPSRSGLSPLGWAALGLAGGAVGLAGVTLVRGRR